MYTEEEFARLRKQAEDLDRKREDEAKGNKYETINGKQVVCNLCENDHFHKGSALLNTRGMTFFGLDWLNESAVTLICNGCGYIHWFFGEIKQI